MAKIWSSIRDEDILTLELEFKKPFRMGCRGNGSMHKQVTDHTKLFIRRSTISFKLNSTFISDELKVAKMNEDLTKLNTKGEDILRTFDGEYIRLIRRFAMMIDALGIYKITEPINFGSGLMQSSEETDYYVYRR